MSWVVTGKEGDQTLYQWIVIQGLPQKQKQREEIGCEVLQGQEKVLQGQEDSRGKTKKVWQKLDEERVEVKSSDRIAPDQNEAAPAGELSAPISEPLMDSFWSHLPILLKGSLTMVMLMATLHLLLLLATCMRKNPPLQGPVSCIMLLKLVQRIMKKNGRSRSRRASFRLDEKVRGGQKKVNIKTIKRIQENILVTIK